MWQTFLFQLKLYIIWNLCLSFVSGISNNNQRLSCEKFGGCSQLCAVNLKGYKCSCIQGFELAQDEWGCDPYDPTLKIIYSTFHGGGLISGLTNDTQTMQLGYDSTGVAYDARNEFVYWSSIREQRRVISRARLGENSQVESIAETVTAYLTELSFDWLTGNVYFVDQGNCHIGICGNQSHFCAVLVEEICGGHFDIKLSLHPNLGIMFWSRNTEREIRRSGMDGSNPFTIVRRATVKALTIDHGSSRIYWLNGGTIESCYFDGQQKTLASQQSPNSSNCKTGMDILGSRIYWNDCSTDEVKSANKFTGLDIKVHLTNSSKSMSSLSVFHLANQLMTEPNPCAGANCSHLCAISFSGRFKCVCPTGMQLVTDNVTCLEQNNGPKVAFAFGGTLKTLNVGVTGINRLWNLPVSLHPKITLVTAIVYNPVNHTLILSDGISKKIYEYHLRIKRLSVLIDEQLDIVESMDIDVIGENLYWVDTGRQTIEALAFRTGARIILHRNLANLHDILVMSDKGLLFATSPAEGNWKIYKLTLDGDVSNVYPITGYDEPSFLARGTAPDTILWSDKTMLAFKLYSLNCTLLRGIRYSIFEQQSDMITIGNTIVFLDEQWHIRVFSNPTLAQLGKQNELLSENESSFFRYKKYPRRMALISPDLSIYKAQLQHHDCAMENPNRTICSHACMLTTGEYVGVCLCPEGMSLRGDNRTCSDDIPLESCSSTEFTCNNGSCISEGKVCDRNPDCGSMEDERNCNTTCAPNHIPCNDSGICIPEGWLCDGEIDCLGREDELNCGLPCDAVSVEQFVCNETVCSDINFICPEVRCVEGRQECGENSKCVYFVDDAGCPLVSDQVKLEPESKENMAILVTAMVAFNLLFVVVPITIIIAQRYSQIVDALSGFCVVFSTCRKRQTDDPQMEEEAYDLSTLDETRNDGGERRGQLTRRHVSEFRNGILAAQFAGNLSLLNIDTSVYECSYDDTLEIEETQLKIEYNKILGSGQFGCVFKATIEYDSDRTEHVALKVARDGCPPSTLKGFLIEIKIMTYIGQHPNIVKLIGAYTAEAEQGVVYIALELCALGSLQGYLRKQKEISMFAAVTANLAVSQDADPSEPINLLQMLKWSQEIAQGMEYLGKKNIVHSDLATRNVLLNEGRTAKISDFGLSRRLREDTSYIKTSKDPLPWRWMAIESLDISDFSKKSDIWSYGITLWEIFTLGSVPYAGLDWASDFVKKLENGLRPGPPKYAPTKLYQLMIECWCPKPVDRPNVYEILERMANFIGAGYINTSEECNGSDYSNKCDRTATSVNLITK